MRSTIRFIVVPQEFWDRQPLKGLVADAMVAERRIRKKSNLETERRRYSQICALIETYASDLPDGRSIDLDDSYLNVLYQAYQFCLNNEETKKVWQVSRAGKSFIPPNLVESSFAAFKSLLDQNEVDISPVIQERLDFYARMRAEVGEFGWVETLGTLYDQKNPVQISQNPVSISSDEVNGNVHKIADLTNATEAQNLSQAFAVALQQNTPVNLSNPFHPQITETLRKFSYRHHSQQKKEWIRVVYGDGSESEPFPLFQLNEVDRKKIAEINEYPELKVSLISMRHLEQDAFVNMAWFKNQQASRPQKFAESEKYCTEVTVAQLDELEKPVRIYLYQTGLQPAVVGFFRGLVMWKLSNPDISQEVVVIPQYHNTIDGSYNDGKVWY